ncbi:c-type cytochrome [Massilia sp. TS11]|uniref:c-type cytochrome n=1 Tax=Massilia sp. TS11 TaxID=2908003 RepID=UPI001EDC5BA7|nr:c-type cytochrome [Massilia sp. TS11]MCG2583782.1 c-type cytochrome [Massilia sp. TS11]
MMYFAPTRLRLALALGAGLLALNASAADTAKPANAKIQRGHYLVVTAGCMDCHTPLKMGPNGPEPDLSRNLSGHPEGMQMPPAPAASGPWMIGAAGTLTAWYGPWGTSFTANLTPDMETGIGKWTLDDFKATLRSGRHLGKGRPVLPPMPIGATSKMTDADLEAIFAYLRSIPAVKNRVPDARPPLAAQ